MPIKFSGRSAAPAARSSRPSAWLGTMATSRRTQMDVWCCYDDTWGSAVWPHNLLPYLILAGTLAGIGYFRYLRANRPAMLDAMGTGAGRIQCCLPLSRAVSRSCPPRSTPDKSIS